MVGLTGGLAAACAATAVWLVLRCHGRRALPAPPRHRKRPAARRNHPPLPASIALMAPTTGSQLQGPLPARRSHQSSCSSSMEYARPRRVLPSASALRDAATTASRYFGLSPRSRLCLPIASPSRPDFAHSPPQVGATLT